MIAGAIPDPFLAVLSHGYGAELLGIAATERRTDPEALIRATLREIDLLEPDLLVLEADGRILTRTPPPALERSGWASWEAPDYTARPEVATLLRAVEVAGERTSTAVALPSPESLAKEIADRPDGPAEDELEDWEELVDGAGLALTDLADALTATPGTHLLLHEHLGGTDPSGAAKALGSLRRLLAHRSRALLLWPHGEAEEMERWAAALPPAPDQIRVLAVGADADAWACGHRTVEAVPPDEQRGGDGDIALLLDGTSDPVVVQEWLRSRRVSAVPGERSKV